MAVLVTNINGHIQKQLTRSLEKILDEANQSGELKLSNRKLKDFPKANDKYNLSDTVIADLSKNRFSELPEEVTTFHFLEKLHCYHNSIRYIPDTVINLQCLIYLDLSRNQLTSLPRELCQLPIKSLLISNNNLTYLPDELNRMSQLTELDASCNQLTHLPPRMGDLKVLQSLVLRNNLLLAVPIEVTFLKLVRLDLRANRIGTLPIEIRDMDSLIELLVDDNPLTSPPASLCKRGRVHIFKYLENEAIKLDRKTGNGSGTLGRRSKKLTNQASQQPFVVDRLKHKRQNVDSGYSTSSDCFEKRWSQEISADSDNSKTWNSAPILIRSDINGRTTEPITDDEHDNSTKEHNYRLSPILTNGNNEHDEKPKPFQQIQTYREYKEALKQQRAQDVPQIYRTKDHPDDQSYKTEPNTPTHQSLIQHPHHTSLATSKSDPTPLNSILNTTKHVFDDTLTTTTTTTSTTIVTSPSLKRIEKTSPFKNISGYSPNHLLYNNGCNSLETRNKYNQLHDYIKPNSPVKSIKNSTPSSSPPPPPSTPPITNGCLNKNNNKQQNMNGMKNNRNISWNSDVVPHEKMTFTMRREIDKAREESDLINQLRNIIEARLKMTLPEDLAPALTDGVVLCHLANHIRPRSVASIHVPSPAVPKLTMARCRRNVDNFIEACRKIGVDEGRLCSTLDVTEALTGRGLPRLLDTILALDDIVNVAVTTTSTTPTTLMKPSRLHDIAVSLLLLAMFFGIIALLIVYPPPN